jgi:DNA recombination protein RmuC
MFYLFTFLEQSLIIISVVITTLLIFILIYLIVKSKNENNKIIDLFKMSAHSSNNELYKEISDFKSKIVDEIDKKINNLSDKFILSDKEGLANLNSFKTDITQRIRQEVSELREKVNLELKDGLENTNKTMLSLNEQLTKIDNTKDEITKLSVGLVELNQTLNDKTQRGVFGESILEQVLFNVYGENSKLYKLQYTLNNVRGDACIFAPSPLGTIFIDSKFPLNNFSKSKDSNYSEKERSEALKHFEQDIKKHIFDVSSKYVFPPLTAKQAIMFIPSESVFIEIVNNHNELVLYSQKMNVCLCSPSTLIAVMTITLSLIDQIERTNNLELIFKDIDKITNHLIDFSKNYEKITLLSNQLNELIIDENRKMNLLTNSINLLEKEKKKRVEYKEIKNNDKIYKAEDEGDNTNDN